MIVEVQTTDDDNMKGNADEDGLAIMVAIHADLTETSELIRLTDMNTK